MPPNISVKSDMMASGVIRHATLLSSLYAYEIVDLPQVDLMNFRVEFVRPRSGRF